MKNTYLKLMAFGFIGFLSSNHALAYCPFNGCEDLPVEEFNIDINDLTQEEHDMLFETLEETLEASISDSSDSFDLTEPLMLGSVYSINIKLFKKGSVREALIYIKFLDANNKISGIKLNADIPNDHSIKFKFNLRQALIKHRATSLQSSYANFVTALRMVGARRVRVVLNLILPLLATGSIYSVAEEFLEEKNNDPAINDQIILDELNIR